VRFENKGSERASILIEATGSDGVSLSMPADK
jgi:hypothetical protein